MTSLADLETMDRAGLARLWSDLIGGEVVDFHPELSRVGA